VAIYAGILPAETCVVKGDMRDASGALL